MSGQTLAKKAIKLGGFLKGKRAKNICMWWVSLLEVFKAIIFKPFFLQNKDTVFTIAINLENKNGSSKRTRLKGKAHFYKACLQTRKWVFRNTWLTDFSFSMSNGQKPLWRSVFLRVSLSLKVLCERSTWLPDKYRPYSAISTPLQNVPFQWLPMSLTLPKNF